MPPRTTHQVLCHGPRWGDFRSPDPLCPHLQILAAPLCTSATDVDDSHHVTSPCSANDCQSKLTLTGIYRSGAISMHPLLSCRGGQLILSPRTLVACGDTGCDLTFVPADTCPSPLTIVADIYPLVRVRGRYGGKMYAMVIFGGYASGKGTNAQHALRIDVTYDFNSTRCVLTVR